MVTLRLITVVVGALLAWVLAVRFARWRRRSRAEWNAYDAEHGDRARYSRAAGRARGERR